MRHILQHECEQEIRRREAEKSEKGQRVVADAVLPDRRVDADRKRNDPCKDDGRHRHDECQEQAVADDGPDGELVLEGISEVALKKSADPDQILFIERPVEPVLFLQKCDLVGIDSLAPALELV
jgi:hypothetical protein